MLDRLIESFALKFQSDLQRISEIRQALDNFQLDGRKIVYVMRRPSKLQTEILKRIFKRLDLPQPSAIFTPEELLKEENENLSRCFVLPLKNRFGLELSVKGVQRYRKALRKYITKNGSQLVFVPVSLFGGLGPRPWPKPLQRGLDLELFPSADIWLLFVYYFHREHLLLAIGKVISVSREVTGSDQLPRLFRELYRQEKLVRGAQPQAKATVESIVLSGEKFEEELFNTATDLSISREEAYAIALRCFNEIAATLRGGAVRILNRILNKIVETVFDKTEINGIEILRETAAKYPTVVLPSHRSHFDYILVGWVLYHQKISLPFVAAGANLNFFPVGNLLRAAGAFFIRRKIGDDNLYKRVLDNYLSYLIKNGHLLAFYLEGGRSRSGTMRQPKLGLLKYLVRSWEEGTREDLMFVPMGITYERIAEETALRSEQQGATKQRESIWALLKLRRIKQRRFGTVTFSVGEPFSLKEFSQLSEKLRREDQQQSTANLTEDLGFAVARSIQEATVMTGTSLTAVAVSSFPQVKISQPKLVRRMQYLLEIFSLMADCPTEICWDESRVVFDGVGETDNEKLLFGGRLREELQGTTLGQALENVLLQTTSWGYLSAPRPDSGDYGISSTQRLSLDYYKNGIMHGYVSCCVLTLVSQRNELAEAEKEIYRLHQLFKPWFLLPYWRVWRTKIARDLLLLAKKGWLNNGQELTAANDLIGLQLTPSGLEKIGWLPSLLRPFFEVLVTSAGTIIDIGLENPLEEDFVTEVIANLAGGVFLPRAPMVEASSLSYVEFALQAMAANFLVSVARASASEESSTGGRARCLSVNQGQIEFLKTNIAQWLDDLEICSREYPKGL